MEILTLVCLYLLSQSPDFLKQLAPIMEKVRSSEDALRFLKDLSAFSKLFDCENKQKKEDAPPSKEETPSSNCGEQTKTPRSPTSGIADAFIEQCLAAYAGNKK